MNNEDFIQIANDLLSECKDYFLDSRYVAENDNQYRVLQLHGNYTIQFREWAGRPFYLMLFRGSKYLFEIELVKILKEKDKYTWYLSKPKNEKNINILNKKLGNPIDVPTTYRNLILNIKKRLKAGSVVYKQGYSLVVNGSWTDLNNAFLDVMHSIILEHASDHIRTIEVKDFDIDSIEALEGYRSDKTYLQTKRNREIVKRRKRFDDHTCQVCGFQLQINKRFIIECHHLISFSEKDERITKMEDLVSLCPTCHRIAHTHKPPYSINELKNLIKKHQPTNV